MTRAPGPLPSAPGGSPALPVLDVGAGVARLMGNRQLYLRALARFRQDYPDAVAAIRAASKAGDIALAQRLAHTLKGAAGMIEAAALHASVLALEQALRAGDGAGAVDPAVDPLFARAGEALSSLLHELDGMALADDPERRETPGEPDAGLRLRAMLDIGDGAAVELVTAARAGLLAELGEREYEAVRDAVMVFDYERALELLDRPQRAGSKPG